MGKPGDPLKQAATVLSPEGRRDPLYTIVSVLSVAGDEINKADAAIHKRLDDAILSTNDVTASLAARLDSINTRVEWIASQVVHYFDLTRIMYRACAACDEYKYQRDTKDGQPILPGGMAYHTPSHSFKENGVYHVHVAPPLATFTQDDKDYYEADHLRWHRCSDGVDRAHATFESQLRCGPGHVSLDSVQPVRPGTGAQER